MGWFRRKEPLDEKRPEGPEEPDPKAGGPLQEVAAVLRVRRWEVRGESFGGFGSPAGKF